ncbi:glucose-1-phosphate cytidylyltransferase [Bdellovibrio bacteriovorus]|uniref:Glucose-1-phosphate cytidylyltransferase n=1 Tax=Bdellovibrio bacteriovorus TaxID=959 RepID=A0A150WL54_BDEBC|nr:glucose-1-phosphate cytidylyltransferase [Bdellovibrio bacteriovorus]KYG64739.1 glucose-1-phosphate cytidylyltransferase [Bdellovibrio bacteriovorus]
MKVVILAGGLGTRLSEETVLRPKPMVEIGGMPILWHIMKIYSAHGYNEFLPALGYKGHVIKDFFLNYFSRTRDFSLNMKDGQVNYRRSANEDWVVHLNDTGHDTLTGGRLLRLKPYLLDQETFMLTYGDGVSDVNIKKLVEFHKSHGKIATVTAVRPPARFGALEIQSGKVIDFHEKPQVGEGWINGGFFVFNKGVFDYLEGDHTILEQKPLERLAKDQELMAYQHDGFWHCMDTIRDKDVLEKMWGERKASWKVWE